MKIIYVMCLILFSASIALGQARNSDRCEVAVAATNPKENVPLGKFTTVLGEEELTTKAFRLPGTRLFVVASVFYTDESMASEKGSDSVMLELALSTGQKRDVLHSLSWAEAEMQLHDFEVGRVMMLVKSGGRPQLVIMECRKDVRH
ncbi:MAG TPA: hypothetical protein VE969_08660 [Pyrinomonadaceae bacterium]|nr:hypothetical protein [Pyrinomonadaceae bacterium]